MDQSVKTGRKRKQHLCCRNAAIALLLALGAACSHFSGLLPSIPFRISHSTEGEPAVNVEKLDNGLTVLIKESHANPIVTLNVWINTGSANEPPELNGVSHFLEHMMFKGTERRPPGKVDVDIESVGGETNAAASKDFTHYYVTVASDYITTGLDVLSDTLMNSTLLPDEVERERQVILEEYRRKQDSSFPFLYDLVCEEAYLAGPYRQSVLGVTETISSITRAQLFDYYKRYYAPDNMVLVVVGDVKPQTVMPLVRKYFGPYRHKARPFDHLDRQTRWATAASIKTVEKDKRETYAVLVFPAPSIENARETIIMDVVLGILSDGRSSRLYQSLREQKKLVSSIGASYGTSRMPGMFGVAATLEAKNLEAMRKAVIEEIERIRTHLVGRRELAKVKKMATNDYYFENETTNGQAEKLGFFYVLTGSEKYEKNYLRELRRVMPADIRRVAQKYLDPKRAVMVVLRPKAG
ncbi:insulinase family protein [Candidatus Sumerlaeota bacterium]|nr:insulinase family protein [Candidatus Sumerlaeota bacterium]